MPSIRLLSSSPEQTHAIAEIIGSHLVGGEILALNGPLGSGKTSFVRGLAHGLGVNPALVSSPTFVIHHRYPAPLGLTLHHLDAYRITSPHDLATVGFDDLLASLNPLPQTNSTVRAKPTHADQYRPLGPMHNAPDVNRIEVAGSERAAEEVQNLVSARAYQGAQAGERRGGEGGVLVIEWPSRIADAIPPDHLDIAFDHLSHTDRLLTLTAHGSHVPLLDILAAELAPHLASQVAACRACAAPISADVASFPFCSQRCRLADLNAWFTGSYRLTRPLHADDELAE